MTKRKKNYLFRSALNPFDLMIYVIHGLNVDALHSNAKFRLI